MILYTEFKFNKLIRDDLNNVDVHSKTIKKVLKYSN